MATLLPSVIRVPSDSRLAGLEDILAGLPSEWTLMVERRIGRSDGPCVSFVLLHPDFGIALVDLLPNDPASTREELLAVLAQEHLGQIPIVSLALPESEIENVPGLMAAAFSAETLVTESGAWLETVIGLLMSAEDAFMKPLRCAEPQAPPYASQPSSAAKSSLKNASECTKDHEESYNDEASRRALSRPLFGWITDAISVLAVLALIAVIAELIFLPQSSAVAPSMVKIEPPSNLATEAALRIPVTPAVHAAISSGEESNVSQLSAVKDIPVTSTQSDVAPRGRHIDKKRVARRRLNACGNDAAAGRFYDSADICVGTGTDNWRRSAMMMSSRGG
jgi:hypothetical protein